MGKKNGNPTSGTGDGLGPTFMTPADSTPAVPPPASAEGIQPESEVVSASPAKTRAATPAAKVEEPPVETPAQAKARRIAEIKARLKEIGDPHAKHAKVLERHEKMLDDAKIRRKLIDDNLTDSDRDLHKSNEQRNIDSGEIARLNTELTILTGKK